jgi:uncharacterized small protein (DUF1192 family)
MGNVTLTLAIPKELKNEMSELKGINWSEEARVLLKDRIERLKALRKLDHALKDSKLSLSDIDEISAKIKKAVSQKH